MMNIKKTKRLLPLFNLYSEALINPLYYILYGKPNHAAADFQYFSIFKKYKNKIFYV